MIRPLFILVIAFLMGCGDDNAEQAQQNGDQTEPMADAAIPETDAEGSSCCQTEATDPHPHGHEGDDPGGHTPCQGDLPYATELIDFSPGSGAGFGQANLPDVVLGPPSPGSANSGSLDVLSLGVNGEITLGFGERLVVDGPGPDFIVWENPFLINGDPDNPFAELGEVSVSADGDQWHTFPCDPQTEDGFDPGCAGWRARAEYDVCSLVPIEAESVGGDPFDLEDLGLTQIRYIKIRDLADAGGAPSAGFDLDAVGAIHIEPDND